MFIRVKSVAQEGRRYEYLQIVRSVRDGDRVRQELVASLGRRDLLVATGKLDKLLQALARFSTRLQGRRGGQGRAVRRPRGQELGPSPGLRPACGNGRACPRSWAGWPKGRRFGFDPERVAFALALQRLVRPGLGSAGRSLGANGGGAGVRCPRLAPILPHPAVAGGDPPGSRAGAVLQGPRPVLGRARSGVRRHHLGLISTATARASSSVTATAATAVPTCRSSCCASPSTARAGRWPGTCYPAIPPTPRL